MPPTFALMVFTPVEQANRLLVLKRCPMEGELTQVNKVARALGFNAASNAYSHP
jgi:hypothetical protein